MNPALTSLTLLCVGTGALGAMTGLAKGWRRTVACPLSQSVMLLVLLELSGRLPPPSLAGDAEVYMERILFWWASVRERRGEGWGEPVSLGGP